MERLVSMLDSDLCILQDGTPLEEILVVTALVGGLRMVWTVSKYHNHYERIVPLVKRVALHNVQWLLEHVNVSIIFKGFDLTVDPNSKSDLRHLMESWLMTYIGVREILDRYGTIQRSLGFGQYQLFPKMHHAAFVCANLHEAIDTVDQLRNIINISDVTSGGKGGDIKTVIGRLMLPPCSIVSLTHLSMWNLTYLNATMSKIVYLCQIFTTPLPLICSW